MASPEKAQQSDAGESDDESSDCDHTIEMPRFGLF